jgi:hypothetical protein
MRRLCDAGNTLMRLVNRPERGAVAVLSLPVQELLAAAK